MIKTLKKVWKYIARYKKAFIVTTVAMLLVQFLGLLSPLIVKNILDDQLVGIEKPWYEIAQPSAGSVSYNGKFYSQSVVTSEGISVIIFEGGYYFSEEIVPMGNKAIAGNLLTITTQTNEVISVPVVKLTHSEVLAFYQPFVNPLTVMILLLLIRFLLSTFLTFIQRRASSMLTVNIVRDVRKEALASLQRMPMTYFETEPAGKTANRVISDVGGLMSLISTIMNLLINATFAVVFAYIGMFYLDYHLALLTFIVFPLVYFWLKYFVKKLNQSAEKVNEDASMITAQLNEIINGISILQIFNFKQQTEDTFNALSKEYMSEKMKETKLHLSIGWNLIRLLGALVTAAIVFYFGNGYLTISGFVVTAGLIYAYSDYLSRLVEPVGTLFREIGNLEHALVKTQRIFKIIDADLEDGTYTELPRFKGDIRFDNVWFSYSEGNPVLKGIDLNIKAGTMVGLVGHTGSGKSSLMSLLLRFYDFKPFDMGKIYVDDVDITAYAKRSYRKHIGIILQDPMLFKGTLAENIRFGENQVTDEEIKEILISIGGQKILDKLEDGVQTMVTRGGGNFSVGEKQIISFARAVVHNPSILIMDEATANIDTETEEMIQNALETVSKGRTMIVIAHRLSTIKNADRIVVLENGMKVEEGKHKDLLAKNGVYANIYRSQIKVNADQQ